MSLEDEINLRRTGLLSTSQLGLGDLRTVLALAFQMKKGGYSLSTMSSLLSGKEFAMMFLEPSTRTRVSFEVAIGRLGANAINFDARSSSFKKGETLKDTVATIGSYGFDGLVVRSSSVGAPSLINQWTEIPVVNAGDGAHQHPTQAMLDLMTLVEYCGSLDAIKGLRIGIVGDVAHSRVARSLIDVMQKSGATVVLVGPATLMTGRTWLDSVEFSNDLDCVLESLDVLYMLRLQQERIAEGLLPSNSEYIARYSLTRERFAKIKDETVIMHPGPVHPGMEIASDIVDSKASLIRRQTANSVFLRMAVLAQLFGKGEINVA